MQCKRHARGKAKAGAENGASTENNAKTAWKMMQARKMMQKYGKQCKRAICKRESESESEAKTMGKRAMQGAKPKQGLDSMHGCRRHVPRPTKCKGRRSKRIRRLKRRCSLLQVLDAASNVGRWDSWRPTQAEAKMQKNMQCKLGIHGFNAM